MRGTQAKKIRAVARQMSNPRLHQMHGKKFGVRETLFWPNGSFRRMIKSMKRLYRRDPQQRALMLSMATELR